MKPKARNIFIVFSLCLAIAFGIIGAIRIREVKGGEQLEKEFVGAFFTMQKAYECGYLTTEDLESIAYYINEDIKYPDTLDNKIENAIKITAMYNIRNRAIEPVSDATVDGFTVVGFYGVYSGNYVVKVRNKYDIFTADVPSYYEEIGGVTFHFMGHLRVKVWRANE